MAKLKAPLMSLGASQKIGDTLVFFNWKGINAVREYVIPANPRSAKQTTQRDNLRDCVTAIHAAQALADDPLDETDIMAYSQLALALAMPMTWFNTIVKIWRDQFIKGLKGVIYRRGYTTAGDTQIAVDISFTEEGTNSITEGDFWYGKSKTALVNKVAGEPLGAERMRATITGLTNGQKYWIQFRPTAHADFVGANSGIYTDIPHA